MAEKVRCPGCSGGVKVKRQFCSACGRRNPYYLPKASRKAALGEMAKAAGYAAVHDMETARLWREAHAEPDPHQREQVISMIFKRGGVA
jgi:hypothetical protein